MKALRYAWRNIWRNPRRTMITVAAISLNVAILIASYGLMDGMVKHLVSNVTNMVTGEVQIHAPGYLVDHSMYKVVKDPTGIMERLGSRGIHGSARSYGYGLIASGNKSAGALFWGVDPDMEKKYFDLADHVETGRYLSSIPKKEIVVGRKLARSLNARIGSEVVLVVQAADGSLGNDLFTVRGILKAAGDRIDRNAAIMHRQDFQELFVSGGRIHEIALNTRGAVPLAALEQIATAAAPGTDVKSWRQLMPSLSDMVNFFDAGMWLFGMIFFLAAALGVMNTMLMSTFERIREFGILKALGTSPWRILGDVAAESFVLCLVSTIIGGIIGVGLSLFFMHKGLDTSIFVPGDAAVSVSGIAFDPVWRATVSVKTILSPILMMWFISLIASLYPAAIAARLDPVKAMTRV
jgi:ABC-type lipoprotein release transport system permease subunit